MCTFIFSTYFYRPSNLILHTHKAPASDILPYCAPPPKALALALPSYPSLALPYLHLIAIFVGIFYVHRIRKTLSKIAYNQFDFIKTSAPKALPRPPATPHSLSLSYHLANNKNRWRKYKLAQHLVSLYVASLRVQ